jgi:hypothetical protein
LPMTSLSPPGASAPKGSVLTLIVNAATGDITDFGVTKNYPRLRALGPVTTDVGTTPAAARSVRLEVSPPAIHSGGWIRILIVNGSTGPIIWGGCFAWQRWVDSKWQGTLTRCLAFVPFRAHSQTAKATRLSRRFPLGRYRVDFVYRDGPATARQPQRVASGYLTVTRSPPGSRP